MATRHNIICISSIDWDFVWQGHQEIMSTLANQGHRVLFIENTGIRAPGISDLPRIRKRVANWLKSFHGIRKEKENLYIYSPVILPFPYSRIASAINRKIMLPILKNWIKATDFLNPIIWTFLPTAVALGLIRGIDNKLAIYYCIADFDQLVKDKNKLKRSETRILKNVDLVFAQGEVLKKRCLEYNKNVFIFPFGVRKSLFHRQSPDAKKIEQKDPSGKKRVTVGYVGGLHKHIDYELMEGLAVKNPDWSITLIGPDQVNYAQRKKPRNITLFGMKKYEELPDRIREMDVCIIPYKINEYTKTVYPTKLNEYLLMGKPVVSTALPEIEAYNQRNGNIVYLAKTREEFFALAKKALFEKDESVIEKRIKAAMANTWEARIKEMNAVIEGKIAEKEKYSEKTWKETLTRVYRTSKKNFIKVAAAALIIYVAVFYSPIIWFIAEPLKISQAPGKADAVVVFGGGVGEGGSPGKSTMERARFSVELYKKGYADKIVYSSGYTYRYNDAENMKLFALSMGVPGKDIMLEQKSGSAYQNVKFTSEILRRLEYRKILLISSPYNMRRAALVFGHIASDIDVVYTPVPAPQFYYHRRPVKVEQIRAIMHEYMGIVYYFIKGYI